MKRLVKLTALLVAIVAIAATLASGDPSVTPSNLLSQPSKYDGQHVVVLGTVMNIVEKTSRRGNDYDLFDLCDTQCVRVFTWGHPSITEGQRLTVRGIFSVVKHVGYYTFYNEVEADDNSL